MLSQRYILGGYTKQLNKGISSVQFNPITGTFDTPELIDKLTQPTYITLSQDKYYLFALHKDEAMSGIVAYTHTANGWHRISQAFSTAIPGCHLAYHEKTRTVYVANYHEGSIDSYQFDNAQQLHPFERFVHQGSSVHPNQQSAHIHFVGFNHDATQLYVCDLGTDHVYCYAIAPASGALTLQHTFDLPASTGPRHLVFHPDLPYVYIMGELSNTITVAQVLPDGSFKHVQTVLTVSTDVAPNAAGAAIRISKDGRFLYTSTRFYNVMTVYQVDSKGLLTEIQQVDSHGEIPRDFTLDDSETYVLVAHQDSNHLTVFERHPGTGLLTFFNDTTYAPECVCIAPA